MGVSITDFIRVSVALQGALPSTFSFGIVCGMFTHSVNSNRFSGPYATLTEAEAAGFTVDEAPEIHAWLTACFAQNPRPTGIAVGRIVGGDANISASLSAVESAAGESGWYITNIESRTEADILLAAAWVETRTKILIAQTADDFGVQESDVTFDGVTDSSGDYSITAERGSTSVTVTHTSAGSETSAEIATALIAAWNLDADAAEIATASSGGSGVVTLTFLAAGQNWTVTTEVAAGTGTPSVEQPATGDIFDQLNLAARVRTAVIWHDFSDSTEGSTPDDGYLDGAWSSRCGAFNLDAPDGVGTWAYKTLSGPTPDTALSATDTDSVHAAKGNVYQRLKGLNFTSKGTMASGRHIDVTTTMDWVKVRIEEAVLALFVGATEKIPYTSTGIALVRAAVQAVLDAGVRNGHISPDFPRTITMPDITAVSAAQKAARTLTFSVHFTIAGAIQEADITVTVEQ